MTAPAAENVLAPVCPLSSGKGAWARSTSRAAAFASGAEAASRTGWTGFSAAGAGASGLWPRAARAGLPAGRGSASGGSVGVAVNCRFFGSKSTHCTGSRYR